MKEQPHRAPLSVRLRQASRLSALKSWQQAIACGLHPSILSAYLCGHRMPRVDDPRIGRLARLIGVPMTEAFAPNVSDEGGQDQRTT